MPALVPDPLGVEAQRCGIQQKAWTRVFGSALMIVSAYYGELAVTADLITEVGAAYGRGRCVFCACRHEGHHSVPFVPFIRCPSQVPERCDRFWFGHIRRILPLLEDLQLLGGRLRLFNGLSKVDKCAFNDAYRHMDWLLTVPALVRDPLGDEAQR